MPSRSAVGFDTASWRIRALALSAATMLLSASASAQQVTLAPTPSQPEGPFYPRTMPADRDSDLTRIDGHAARALGPTLYLSGRVLARDGRALAGATVELWQCDVYGRYHHVGDDGGRRDDNFQGYGTATTDGEGRYAFTTIRPVAYAGRPAHLHVRVSSAGGAPLTTQLYVAADSAGRDAVLAMSPAGTRERLSITLAPAAGAEPGALAATYDFVK